MNKVIKKAVDIAGSQEKLAILCGLSQPAVNKWLKGGRVAPQHVQAVVNATNGKVKAYEIRPDLPHLFPVIK